ncbi:threonine/homoserine/homoserine lactone efflux protein [Paucibacter oligotrophus]|uniref:Threonine/homoserine/homoserine lactone efflux protein n=1 Tax=Roseateles oligotrophus TaxID=1769250 RepID=A0A840LKN5_9BURK|nr:LysE family translocator [Roseateles oligotrophus]MBB4845847.1 threonine/homoserine/homoserine lactone efflux protein [Roseateles oligotrophus]
MLTLQTAITFFGLALLLGFTPGPDNVFVLMQSATQGRRAGFFVVLGLCIGLLVHTAAIALGLAAVFAASALAFTVLKFVGAAYLAYLAWQVLRAPVGPLAFEARGRSSMRAMLGRGVVMNLSNPKVVFFFLALLPQFVDASRGPVAWQIVQLGLLFIAATLLSFGAITYFAGTVSALLKRSTRAQQALNRLAGTVFLGLALRLALSER